MNRQEILQTQSFNGLGHRKETGSKVDNKLVTGNSNSSRLTTAGMLMGGNASPSHERLLYLATCLIGHAVEVQVIDGSVYSGIFHAANADRDFGIILKMARLMKTVSSHGQTNYLDSVNKPPSKTLIIPARELVQVMAKGVSVSRDGLANELQYERQQEILTDSSISQSHHVAVERELGRWVPDVDDTECPELDNIFDGPWNRGWDQFEANEMLFGVKSTFNEELYTTKLDRGPQMKELEREALRMAREIEGEDTQDLHLAEERGLQLHGDYELDEEARFSSVFRGARGYDEKENILDLRNIDTFADVSGFVVSKPITDFSSGINIGGSLAASISLSRDLVETSPSITGSKQYLSVSDNEQFPSDRFPKSVLSFDRGNRVQEYCFGDKPEDYTKEESDTPISAVEAQASRPEYSQSSVGPKKAVSDKVGLSPNAAAYAPTPSTHEKNSPGYLSDNAASAKQNEAAQSLPMGARPGSSTSSTSDCGNAAPASTNTGISSSSSVTSLASERSTLNPHAKEYKLNPNAKCFTPKQTSFRPASPVSGGSSLYYSTNAPTIPNMHNMPISIGMGPAFSNHQPVTYNQQAAPMQSSPQTYYHPNELQYGQHMLLGQPRQVLYMPPPYPPEMQYRGREF